MDIMRIVDPNIEEPKYLKPINDTKLVISYHKITIDIDVYKSDENFTGWDEISQVNFYEINILRQFGDKNYRIFNVCTIPADIEPIGIFATESPELSSSIMLFRIVKLFNDGRLLCKYVPPYYNIYDNDIQYVDLHIHFNRYRKISNWMFDKDGKHFSSKKKFIDLFKHYAEEINNFIN